MDAAASNEATFTAPVARIVAASFVNHIFTFGPIYSFGVFLPVIKADLEVSLTEVSAISSTMNTAQFIGSLLAGLAIPRLSHSCVAACGALAVLFGLGLLSWIDSVFQAYPAVLLAGLGLGASNLAGIVALNTAVASRQRATLVGLATCGTSVGTILLPQFYTLLTEELGWRWAMRVNAITSCVLLAIAAPFFRAKAAPSGQDQSSEPSACMPLRDTRFLCWWLNMCLCFLGYFAPSVLLAQFAKTELELAPNMAAISYTLMGVSALLTRLCLGFITHLCGGPRRVHFVAQVMVGIIACFMPFCWNLESLLVWSIIYGCAIGPVIALISVVLSELFGTEDLAIYMGLSRIGVGAGNLLGVPLISMLVESQGYPVALVSSGCLVSFSTVFLILLQFFHRRPQARV